MKQLGRRITHTLCILLMLCLSGQSYAVAFMPTCRLATDSAASAADMPDCHQSAEKQDKAGSGVCQHCSVCQDCHTGGSLPAQPSLMPILPARTMTAAFPSYFYQFIPTQPQRPPRLIAL